MEKKVFILDENVLLQSFTCKNNNKDDDFDSIELVTTILRKCHKLGLSCELQQKYFEKMKMFERPGMIMPIAKIWSQFLVRKEKQRYCESYQKNLPLSIQHDSHVINPTLFLSGILVTTDEELKEKLRMWAKENGFQVDVKSPKEAIEYLDTLT
jgi:hypothetical protein